MTHFAKKKNFSPLYRPQPADRKSLDELQRTRKPFLTLVAFFCLFLVPKDDPAPLFLFHAQTIDGG
jgi:hypothetical protein